MNWKQEAVEKLRRYGAMKTSVKSIPLELARLEAEACAIRGASMDKLPTKGGGNGREQAALNNLVHRQELAWALEQAGYWVQAADMALGTLDPTERLILHRLYVSPEKGGVAELMGTLRSEQSTIYRKRDEALRKFTIALYGAVES